MFLYWWNILPCICTTYSESNPSANKHKILREVFKVQKDEKLHRINNSSAVNPSNPSIWFTQYRNKFIENRIIGNLFVKKKVWIFLKSAFNLWRTRGCLHSCPYVTEVSRFDPFMSNTLSLCCMHINEVQNLHRIFIIGFSIFLVTHHRPIVI